MTAPRVSVVLPVYNGAAYLRGSIESVLDQQAIDYELLIWDDGSTDDSRQLVAQYTDSRVRVFSHQANRGLFETLNAAIRQARGELIRLWSQDDVMKPDCLRLEAAFHRRHPEIAMSYCQYDLIDGTGKLIHPAKSDATPEVIAPLLANQIMFYHGSITGNIANVMLKRETLDRLGLFREDLRVAGDFEMWLRIAREHLLGFLRRPLIYLRAHRGQFSRRKGISIQFMRECRPLFKELHGRLPLEIQPYARRYYRRHHLLLDAHYLLRCVAAGDVALASQAFRQIAQSENPWLILTLLFLTCDRRWFRLTPKYVHA